MTAIAQKLDRKLKSWEPRTAQKVEKLITEIIELADQEKSPVSENNTPAAVNSFFADTNFYDGPAPGDSALNHDKYLYGDKK